MGRVRPGGRPPTSPTGSAPAVSAATPITEAAAPYLALFWEWVLPAGVLALAVPFLLPRELRGRTGEARVSRALRERAAEVRDDVLLPNGRGGLTQVDHLALTPAGIWVVETKDYGGLIFGREREPLWTQKLRRTSRRFGNPLHQNFGHVKAVEAALPGAPVFGLVVFTDRSRFPRGMPEGVVQAGDLEGALAGRFGAGPVPVSVRARWDALGYLIREGKAERDAHRAQVGALRRRRIALGMGAGLAVLAVVLFVGMRFG